MCTRSPGSSKVASASVSWVALLLLSTSLLLSCSPDTHVDDRIHFASGPRVVVYVLGPIEVFAIDQRPVNFRSSSLLNAESYHYRLVTMASASELMVRYVKSDGSAEVSSGYINLSVEFEPGGVYNLYDSSETEGRFKPAISTRPKTPEDHKLLIR